jgi:hypothetical protein
MAGFCGEGGESLGYNKRKFCEELKFAKDFLCICFVYCIQFILISFGSRHSADSQVVKTTQSTLLPPSSG